MRTTHHVLFAISIGALSPMAFAETEEAANDERLRVSVKSSKAQDQAKGFFTDDSLSGTTRNFYAQERLKRHDRYQFRKDDTQVSTRHRDTWTQGTIVNYTSGFTEGTVGFGIEAALYNEVALQQGRARIAGGGNRTLTDSKGEAVEQWSKMGLANMRARIANTTLVAGRQSIDTPVLASIGNRALPSSFNGFSVVSDELENLSFQGASFDRVSPRTEQSLTKFSGEYANRGITADRMSMFGVDYQPLKSLKTSFYTARLDDLWDQYYVGLNHNVGNPESLAIGTNFVYYKTLDSGRGKLGDIDNNAFSLAVTGTHQAHSLTLAYQEIDGNEYFDYAHETNSIYLANSLVSDFNGPNEKSLQIAYGLDMNRFGVPGLALNAYTARGWGIDGTHYRGKGYSGLTAMDGEHHYEYGVGSTYIVQNGPLKATKVRATYTTHRASQNQADGSVNELRLVTTIPFKAF